MGAVKSRWWPLLLLLSTAASSAQGFNAGVEFSRYVGVYTAPPYYRLSVTVDGGVLKGDLANGQPPGTLLPLPERGRFQLKEAPFEIQFLQDKGGNVLGVEIAGRGRTLQMRRTDDVAEMRESIKSVAANTDTSVNAQVFNGYKRTRDASGKFQTETYVVGNGGFQYSGMVEESASRAKFAGIVRTLGPGLARQQYFPAASAAKADLLLMVYWGATGSDEQPAVLMEETWDPASHTFRRQLDHLNARLLGFDDVVKSGPVPGMQSLARDDVVKDMEASRYWVAVVALDFKAATQDKNVKVLWSVRYSLRSRGTNFVEALPEMTSFAGHYFGRDSKGLVNPAINRNEDKGRVELGEMRIVEVFEDKTAEQPLEKK